jgi:hypothetical protein
MEGATNARASRLTASLNGALADLSARLEGAVNEALQVRLGCSGGVRQTPPRLVWLCRAGGCAPCCCCGRRRV